MKNRQTAVKQDNKNGGRLFHVAASSHPKGEITKGSPMSQLLTAVYGVYPNGETARNQAKPAKILHKTDCVKLKDDIITHRQWTTHAGVVVMYECTIVQCTFVKPKNRPGRDP